MKKVPTRDLLAGMIPAKSIYDSKGRILVAKGIALTSSYINRLYKFRVPEVYVITDEGQEWVFEKFFSESACLAASKTRSLLTKMKKYQTVNFDKNSCQIEQVVFTALDNRVIHPYLDGMRANPVVLNHCLRTALLSVGMGLTRGYDFINLGYLASSAILHDCGMGNEFDEENNHHLDGFVKLRSNHQLEIINALVSMQHHERFDGLGRPLGLAKYQIIEFARLIAVADYYDRLIHMHDNTPRQAVLKIIGAANNLFDPDMVDVFDTSLK